MEFHIGAEIKSVFDRRGMTISEFARRINFTRENVYSIFARKTIDTGILLSISQVLEFDFFELYSQRFNPSKDDEVKRLKDEVALLRELNELLKKNS